MKEPTTGTKIRMAPAKMPGSAKGRTSRLSTVRRRAPSERAASIRLSSIASSEM